MTRAGATPRDLGRRIPWTVFRSFVKQIDMSSALARDLYPEEAAWGERAKTNSILADIYDLLGVINANLISIGSGKRQKAPKSYPRPGQKKPDEKRIGKGAVTHEELKDFFIRKRKEHGRLG